MSTDIQRLGYSPRTPCQFDLEVFTVTELRRRTSRENVRTTHQYEFYTLVCVTQGNPTQLVDIEPIPCAPGSLLTLRPGQAHNFGRDDEWDGWLVLFRPEFVLSTVTAARTLAVDLDRLQQSIRLKDNERRTVTAAIKQIHKDMSLNAPPEEVNALLRHQLHALLTRLSILQGRQQVKEPVISPATQRFKRFQQLVEERFAQWHQVADYANHLGYSEKTLARTVANAVGMTAKAFIAARINLEAKRLLVHTNLPVAAIADKLGFEEPTNFSKFFKREAGCAPAEFRQLHSG